MPNKIVFSEKQINDILDMFANNISAPKIAKKYNVSKTKIINTLHENGIPYRDDRLTKETEDLICKLYAEYHNCRLVGDMIGRNKNTVRRVLLRKGVEIIPMEKVMQTYTLNETYFDSIDTNNKAYILGLICADGCISSENYHSIIITLQEKDKHILDKINEELESNRPLYFRDMKKKKNSYQNQYVLSITNKHMWIALNNIGVIQNKSLKLKYPVLDDKLQKSFILGYIDGDGCIYKGYNKVGILGTKAFLETMNEKIYQFTGISGKIYDIAINNITKSLEIFGKNKVPMFLNWLYEDQDMFLIRKKQIYLDRYVNNSLTQVAAC